MKDKWIAPTISKLHIVESLEIMCPLSSFTLLFIYKHFKPSNFDPSFTHHFPQCLIKFYFQRIYTISLQHCIHFLVTPPKYVLFNTHIVRFPSCSFPHCDIFHIKPPIFKFSSHHSFILQTLYTSNHNRWALLFYLWMSIFHTFTSYHCESETSHGALTKHYPSFFV